MNDREKTGGLDQHTLTKIRELRAACAAARREDYEARIRRSEVVLLEKAFDSPYPENLQTLRKQIEADVEAKTDRAVRLKAELESLIGPVGDL